MSKSPRSGTHRGTRQTRKGRISEANRAYHVSTITYQRQPLFHCHECGRFVVKAMRAQARAGNATTMAFVVMPDHLHWLLQITGRRPLWTIVNAMKSGSARRIRLHHDRTDSVWQKGFYDRAMRRDDDVRAVARYIVANPLREGLVRSICGYPLWDAIWV